jgi:hypothetical protein
MAATTLVAGQSVPESHRIVDAREWLCASIRAWPEILALPATTWVASSLCQSRAVRLGCAPHQFRSLPSALEEAVLFRIPVGL